MYIYIYIYIYAYNGLNQIYVPKNISICDLLLFFYRYCILVFDLLRRVTDICIFRFESKRITNQIKNLQILLSQSVNNKNYICIIGLSIHYPF